MTKELSIRIVGSISVILEICYSLIGYYARFVSLTYSSVKVFLTSISHL